MLMVTTELQELLTYVPHLYTQWKLERWPGSIVHATEIGRSQDCTLVPRNLKNCTQFPDSENAQHIIKIAQIPRLSRTHIWYDQLVCLWIVTFFFSPFMWFPDCFIASLPVSSVWYCLLQCSPLDPLLFFACDNNST